MKRPCLDCHRLVDNGTRCHACELAWQSRRNQRPARAIYRGDWPAESRAIRDAQPWCSVCSRLTDLTVDHPTRAVLCRPCHARLENERRARQKVVRYA